MPPGLIPEFEPDLGRELQPPREEVRLPPTDDYRDPAAAIDPGHGGRWLAGFAPVGNSEMVVIVQQSHEQATAADRSLLRQLGWWFGATLFAGLAITGALVAVRTRVAHHADRPGTP